MEGMALYHQCNNKLTSRFGSFISFLEIEKRHFNSLKTDGRVRSSNIASLPLENVIMFWLFYVKFCIHGDGCYVVRYRNCYKKRQTLFADLEIGFNVDATCICCEPLYGRCIKLNKRMTICCITKNKASKWESEGMTEQINYVAFHLPTPSPVISFTLCSITIFVLQPFRYLLWCVSFLFCSS